MRHTKGVKRIIFIALVALSLLFFTSPAFAWQSSTISASCPQYDTAVTPETTDWRTTFTVVGQAAPFKTVDWQARAATRSDGKAVVAIRWNAPSDASTLVEIATYNKVNTADGRSVVRLYAVGCGPIVGTPGTPGTPGRDGSDGKDGKNGLNGKDGKDGLPGAPGKDGLNGKDGSNGLDGLPGAPGKDGLNGKNGADGQPGKDGVDGKDAVGYDCNGLPVTPLTPISTCHGATGAPGKDGTGYDCAGNSIVPGLIIPALCPGKDGTPGADGTPGKDGVDAPVVTPPTPVTPTVAKARISGRGGCVKRTFTARVTGSSIATVAWSVDGISAGSGSSLKVTPSRYRYGTHKVSARVTYTAGATQKQETLKFAFQRCKDRPVKPRTTG